MKCRTSARLLHSAAGGDLDRSQAAALARHTAVCDSCRAIEHELGATLEALRELRPASPFSAEERWEIGRAIRAAIDGERGRRAARRGSLRSALLVPAAALGAGALAVILLFDRPAARRRDGRAALSTRARASASLRIPSPRTSAVDHPAAASAIATAPSSSIAALTVSAPPKRPVRRRDRATPALARIEIETADPNVRIIWLFRREAKALDTAPARRISEEVS